LTCGEGDAKLFSRARNRGDNKIMQTNGVLLK
jgi:hypothetical protein